jgi:predicted DNA-binding transcriptional regulator YafY
VRADRLVAILLMLQTKGLVTASRVAEELEISERTARRDLEALGMAGLPVFARQGRGGGWQLAGGGRTDLSGLTAAEARALFLVAGPSSTATPGVRAALRKLTRALPEPMRASAEAASRALIVEPGGWDHPAVQRTPPAHLDVVQTAVVEGVQLVLGYIGRDGAESTRTIHPLGIAAKGSRWYLLAGTEAGQRTFRVDRITSVEPTGEPVVRPEGFDLEQAWRDVTTAVEERRLPLRARALVAPDSVEAIRWVLGERVRIGPPAADGRVQVELRGHHVHSLAGQIAGFGSRIEVTEPDELRARLASVGAELTDTYARTAVTFSPSGVSER